MPFMDNLKKQSFTSPAGALGVRGVGPSPGGLNQIRQFLDHQRVKDQEDFKSRASFTNDLSLRNQRMLDMNAAKQPMNTVFDDGDDLTAFQKANLGLEREKLNLNKDESALDRKLKEDTLGINRDKLALDKDALELDKKKNDQIYETKIKDLERKANEAAQKADLAERNLQQRTNSAEALNAHREAQIAAATARHELEIAQRDRTLAENTRMNDARIQQIRDAAEAAGLVISEETLNEDGTKKTTITRRGDKAADSTGRVKVLNAEGKSGTVSVEESKSLPAGWKVVQ